MRKLALVVFILVIAITAYSEFIPANPDIDRTVAAITRSDDNMIIVDFAFPGIQSERIEHNGEFYDLLTMEREGAVCIPGAPQVPSVTRLFAIPDFGGVKIKSIVPEWKTVDNINPYPFIDDPESPEITAEWYKDDNYYQKSGFYPQEWVTIGEPAILRDYRVIPVTVRPIRVDASSYQAQILTGLHLEIEFDNSPVKNAKTRHFQKETASFGNLYGSIIENYDWITPNGENLKGSVLIIYPNVANVLNIIQPLIDWKKRMGYAVQTQEVATTATTTVIYNHILQAYQNSDPPLEYVILIGDATGSICIPCYTIASGSSDHPYTMLEGDDILADVIIGRISVSNLTQLQIAVNKILYYEKTPTLTTTHWYQKGGVLAASSSSGLSTIQVNQTIRSWWLEDGFTEVDTMWYTMGGSMVTYFMNTLNEGVSVFNARGYLGMGGISAPNVYNLSNSGKLPFAVMVTCGTGDFNGTSLSEAFMIAGTPNNLTGGIGGVGQSTFSNHTRFNNCYVAGLWFGLHQEGMTHLGELTFRGKYELYMSYQNELTVMTNVTNWLNLMGDPTTEIRTKIPRILTVTHPDSIPVGVASFTVTIADPSGIPLADRYVCLWKDNETYVGGRTNALGVFTAPIETPTTGTLKLTITYFNDYPYVADIPVYQSAVNPSFSQVIIDDDISGQSSGNDDGFANPSETLELNIGILNYGNIAPATGISAVLSTTDENIEIFTSSQGYPIIAPGQEAFGNGMYVLYLGSYFPQDYLIPFTLTINSNEGTFVSAFNIPVNSGECEITLSGFSGQVLQPGGEDDLSISMQNIGEWGLLGVTGELLCSDPQIDIIDDECSFGDISAGMEANNNLNPFRVGADNYATSGRTVEFQLHLTSANGFTQDIAFEMGIGDIASSDPMGPDEYGYYCIDNTDIYYDNHPRYEWIEIDPHFGGAGTQIYLADFGDQQDKSRAISLPFDFTFYGETYDTITINSNGWLAMGNEAYHTDFRNWPMPSASGPNSGMICPFWDDLKMGNGGVYAYYDEQNHIFIIEYSRVLMMYSSGGSNYIETFEALLYDPEFYLTPSGDGEIIANYHTVNAAVGVSDDNRYFTTGIQNREHSIGLQYAYWNIYNPGAAILETGRSLKFTTEEPLRFPVPTSVEVLIEPVNPPIIIPATGGSFDYNLTLTNPAAQYSIFDLWIKVFPPDGSEVYITFIYDYELPAGQTDLFELHQVVPGRAPAGEYDYYAFIGDYENENLWDESSFTFIKSGVDLTGGGDWTITGWEGVTAEEEVIIPKEYALHSAFPNPFNPETNIEFDIPEAGNVSLTIYDISGRETARLVDGYMPAGIHTVKFDGSNLSSGIYFAVFRAEGFTKTQKLLLVK